MAELPPEDQWVPVYLTGWEEAPKGLMITYVTEGGHEYTHLTKLAKPQAITCPICGEHLDPQKDILPSTGRIGCWRGHWSQ